MDEGKQTKPGDDTSAQIDARHDEATSSETLSDIKQAQTDTTSTSDSASETSGESDSNSAPAPDGTPDTTRGGTADDRDSGGPM